MNIIDGLNEHEPRLDRSVLTIGNFDGVHRGPRRIIEAARQHASRLAAPTVVLTFEPHPLHVLRPETAPPRLSRPRDKLGLLGGLGVDVAVVAHCTPEFLAVEATTFLRDVIVARFHPLVIVEGPNFGFGRGRAGNVETLREHAAQLGYTVHIVDPVAERLPTGEEVRISSSLVRRLLSEGQVDVAAHALGRYYQVEGEVVPGAHRGRVLGFPTANVAVGDQMVPGDGVYAGLVRLGERSYASAISIGRAVTFDDFERRVEAYVLDFEGDLYYQTIAVEFRAFLRTQTRFESQDALIRQIEMDVQQVREMV